MKRIVLASIAIAIAACGPAPSDAASRCARVADDLATCLGADAARLDCSALADADLDRVDVASQGISCELLTQALPIDGDPQAATCRVLGVGCVAAVNEAAAGDPARYPILLVNGIDTSPLFRWSDRIVKTMRGAGNAVFLATLTPYEPPRTRAPELWKRIEEVRTQTGAAKVNLLCHSLGGLDCRYVASPGGLAADLGVSAETTASAIASITTVGTAHHGTRVADVLLGILPDGDREKAVTAFATLAGDFFSPNALESDVHLRDALRALSLADAPAFDSEIVDAEGVEYQSWAGYSRAFGSGAEDVATACEAPFAYASADRMALPLVPFADLVKAPNDGFVAIESAKHGVFRGCIPADHMEQLGQKNLPDVNVRTGFDVARFYAFVASDLAKRGF